MEEIKGNCIEILGSNDEHIMYDFKFYSYILEDGLIKIFEFPFSINDINFPVVEKAVLRAVFKNWRAFRIIFSRDSEDRIIIENNRLFKP